MANSLLTIDMVTREALRVAHESCTFIGTINRQYDDSFAKSGAKIGSSLRIRQPNQYTRRTGSRVMDVQEQTETSITATVATQDGVDMKFNSAELALSIDEFSMRYIEPAVKMLVSSIEADVLVDLTKGVYNLAGTAGTVVGSSSNDISALGNARAKLNQYLAPKSGDRCVQLDSITMASVSNAVKAWFEPKIANEAFREGLVGRSAMADFYENERTWTMTNGSDVTGSTHSAAGVTDGGSSVIWDSSATISPTVGAVFTIAGVYSCHPETKQAYSHLQQFAITAIDTGTRTMTVSPSIYLSGAKKNVVSSSGGTLATTDFNSQTLTFVGAANTAYRQNLMYHKDFATFITADLPLMDDAHKCVRRTQDGLSMRVWQGSDIRNDELLMRIDILYGWKMLRPEWACRITN